MIYLSEFYFPSQNSEANYLAESPRAKMTCYDSFYPFGLFAGRGLKALDLADVTILYGGNGSGTVAQGTVKEPTAPLGKTGATVLGLALMVLALGAGAMVVPCRGCWCGRDHAACMVWACFWAPGPPPRGFFPWCGSLPMRGARVPLWVCVGAWRVVV